MVVVDLQIENPIEQVPTHPTKIWQTTKTHVHRAPVRVLLAFHKVPKVPREEHSRITGASFSPVAPHRLAVVSGTKVGSDPAVGVFHSPDGNVDIPYVLLYTGNMPLFFFGCYWAYCHCKTLEVSNLIHLTNKPKALEGLPDTDAVYRVTFLLPSR